MITEICARQAYSDSGTIGMEVQVGTAEGITGKALCAPGLITGRYECPVPRDCSASFHGNGMEGAAEYINLVAAQKLRSLKITDQQMCDQAIAALDFERMGTIGASALSEAILQGGAKKRQLPLYQYIGGERPLRLPVPTYAAAMGSTRYGNFTAGGKPGYYFAAFGYDTFLDAVYGLWLTVTSYTALLTTALGFKIEMDSESMIPKGSMKHDEELLALMHRAIVESGQENRMGICINMGADHFYDLETDTYRGIFCAERYARSEFIAEIERLCLAYPIILLQDPMQADDFAGFAEIRSRVPALVMAGEAVASRQDRLIAGANQGAFDAVSVSPACAGTMTRTKDMAELARQLGLLTTISGGHGEDITVGDYAVGLGCDMLMGCGVSFLCNRLLEIERELGAAAEFSGAVFWKKKNVGEGKGKNHESNSE